MRTCIWSSLIFVATASAVWAADDDIVGRWDLQVEPDGYPSWINVKKEANNYKIQFVWSNAGVENPPAKAKVEGNTVTFQARDLAWSGTASGDSMKGTATEANGKVHNFSARRFVPDIDVSGKWTVKIEGQRGKAPLLTFLQKDDQIVGDFRAKEESPISDAKIIDGVLSFKVAPGKRNARQFEAKVHGDLMEGTTTMRGTRRKFTAEREREWGDAVELFNRKDLKGWKPLGDPNEFHWKVIDGIMTNEGRGANIVSEKTFRDFKLHVEFRVPRHSNSGVYLRGRYEVQVEDSFGQRPGSGSCGAIYSRLIPSENAAKAPDEWQTFDITLVGEYVTVVHNGKKIIDNRELEGITGGAIDSNEHEAGPIYIQGDHGKVEYRKITIWPSALLRKAPKK